MDAIRGGSCSLNNTDIHDTIEDTATDCDDIIEQFGPEFAR
jgi:(p)ppGpp synthase/HD superfamily hydrolase